MAIDILRDNLIKAMPESIAKKPASGVKSNDARSVADIYQKEDSVSLTDSAKSLARATETARKSSGIDYEKVESLRQALKDGTYKIDYQSVANRMLDAEDELNSIFG